MAKTKKATTANNAVAKSAKQRPATRTIVRWNGKSPVKAVNSVQSCWKGVANQATDDLDKQLLLSIHAACASAGIKIPWASVAELMGERISEGAIVQHLAKLRSRMETEGFILPPTPRRSGSTTTGKLTTISNNKVVNSEAHGTPDMILAPKYGQFNCGENTINDGFTIATPPNFDHAESRINLPGYHWGSQAFASPDIADRKETPTSKIVVFRLAPESLRKLASGKDFRASPEQPCMTYGNHEHLSNSYMQEDVCTTASHALMHLGAQHYPQWADADLTGLGALGHAGQPQLANSPFRQFATEQPTQHLQMNDDSLHPYDQEINDLEMQGLAATTGYLNSPIGELFGMGENSFNGSSQENMFAWMDHSSQDENSKSFDENLAMEDFINSEFFNE